MTKREQEHQVTMVHDAGRGRTFSVPGMRVTTSELRAAVDGGGLSQVWCDVCAESIRDCPHLRHEVNAPDSWSTVAGGDYFAQRAEI